MGRLYVCGGSDMVNQMTNAQVALMAAAQVHQHVSGSAAPGAPVITNTANHFLKWLRENEEKQVVEPLQLREPHYDF